GLGTLAVGRAPADSARLDRNRCTDRHWVRNHARSGIGAPGSDNSGIDLPRSWHGVCYCACAMTGAPVRILAVLLIVGCLAACREQGDITIHSLNFEG